ncbi:MAG: proton-conducting transporter membrane subunit [Gammaproteobacteria bacterium]
MVPLPWHGTVSWVPSLGVNLDWRVDALSAQFLLLITGIGTVVFLYAGGYLAHTPRAGRLYGVLLLFMAAMIGVVSADHLLVLFLCWELTSLTSFFLVGFKHTDAAARASARQALFVTLGGGLALLAAFILLHQITGSWSLHTIAASGPLLAADPRLPAALALLFIGCFTKSAQFPFHFWLPNAMSAPTPVSAYLHSATMVKLGIYLLARLDPAFNDLLIWEAVLVGVGTLTAVWAAVLALRERDLKRILARSTVSALGTLTLLIGLPNEGAALAVIAFLFAHALYKAPLFFVAGNIDHATGTRSIDHLMGLRRRMPWTTVAARDGRGGGGGGGDPGVLGADQPCLRQGTRSVLGHAAAAAVDCPGRSGVRVPAALYRPAADTGSAGHGPRRRCGSPRSVAPLR